MRLGRLMVTAVLAVVLCAAPLTVGLGGLRVVLDGPDPPPPAALVPAPWADEDLTTWGEPSEAHRLVGGMPIENRSTGQGCTSGLPWVLSDGQVALVTAGHCAPTGGIFADDTGFIGTVGPGEQTWETGHGTRQRRGVAGAPEYHGDLALIRIAAVTARLVTGPIVGSAPAERGQRLCTLGTVSGELCGWVVTAVGVNAGTPDGLSRNVVLARKKGHCVRPGDSGGPVYRYAGDGLVVVGVISSTRAPEDFDTGRFQGSCEVRFTDVGRIAALWDGRAATVPSPNG